MNKVGSTVGGVARTWKIVHSIVDDATGNCVFVTESDAQPVPEYSFFVGWSRDPEAKDLSRYIRFRVDGLRDGVVRMGDVVHRLSRMMVEAEDWVKYRIDTRLAERRAKQARRVERRRDDGDAPLPSYTVSPAPPAAVSASSLVRVQRAHLPRRHMVSR